MILILAEKPKAAFKIANYLGNGKIFTRKLKNLKYFEFYRDGKRFVCVSALGHLFKLDSKNKKWIYPDFDVKWFPSYKEIGKRKLKNYLKALEILGKNAKDIIIATDYDVEGDVIGFNILRFVFKRANAKRMKFSALTKFEIENSFRNLMSSLNFGQVFAGLARHYLDFYWGVNLTRALSLSVRNFVKKRIMISAGRVQSPTLYLVYKREKEIENFVPKIFWIIKAIFEKNGKKFEGSLKDGKIFEKEKALKIFEECKKESYGKVVRVDVERKKVLRPVPFDLTSLQREAYKYFGFSPSKTLKIAEDLYLDGLISYPRTSSQKIPPSINIKKIILSLSQIPSYSKISKEIIKEGINLRQGKKVDPAHPAIHPTGLIPKNLSKEKMLIYDLIVRRFLASCYKDAIKIQTNVLIKVSSYLFEASGSFFEKEGWYKIYSFVKPEIKILPSLKEGEKIKIEKINLIKDKTKPPSRYNQGKLLEEMEKRKLGTKGTRSRILDILYKRKYLEGRKSIRITNLGKALVKTLEEFVPEVLSENLTRKFEEEMEEIMKRNKSIEEVLEEAKSKLKEILEKIKKNEKKIGKKLLASMKSL